MGVDIVYPPSLPPSPARGEGNNRFIFNVISMPVLNDQNYSCLDIRIWDIGVYLVLGAWNLVLPKGNAFFAMP